MYNINTLISFLTALFFVRVAYAQETCTVFFDLNDDGVESISMNYKIENCTYRKK